MAPFDAERLKAKKEELDSRRSFGFWVPQEGRNSIRILPPKEDGMDFFVSIYQHWHNGLKRGYVCQMRQRQEPCYFCEVEDEAVVMRARERYLTNIIDLDNPDDGILVWNFGSGLLQEMFAYFLDEEWGDLSDPDKGYDLILERSGKGLDTEYRLRCKKNASPAPEFEAEDLPDLMQLTVGDDYDTQQRMHAGGKSDVAPQSSESDDHPECFGEFDDDDEACEKCPSSFACEVKKAGEAETKSSGNGSRRRRRGK